MKVKWLVAHYGFNLDHGHIAVPKNAQGKLQKLAQELEGTNDLVGVYIPEGTEDVYGAGAKRARIAGAVRLLPMPPEKKPTDYFYQDVFQSDTETPRWPYGWPSRVVLVTDPTKIITLRTMVEMAHPKASFGDYTAQFQQGPIKLGFEMKTQVNNLMTEIFGNPPWADETMQ